MNCARAEPHARTPTDTGVRAQPRTRQSPHASSPTHLLYVLVPQKIPTVRVIPETAELVADVHVHVLGLVAAYAAEAQHGVTVAARDGCVQDARRQALAAGELLGGAKVDQSHAPVGQQQEVATVRVRLEAAIYQQLVAVHAHEHVHDARGVGWRHSLPPPDPPQPKRARENRVVQRASCVVYGITRAQPGGVGRHAPRGRALVARRDATLIKLASFSRLELRQRHALTRGHAAGIVTHTVNKLGSG